MVKDASSRDICKEVKQVDKDVNGGMRVLSQQLEAVTHILREIEGRLQPLIDQAIEERKENENDS